MDFKCKLCEKPSKYSCPKCRVRTCSLKCCNDHKSAENCDGIVAKFDFVPLSEFKDEDIVRDYDFLQEVGRYVGLSRRDKLPMPQKSSEDAERSKTARNSKPGFKVERLRRMCQLRGTNLRIMPSFMQKHKRNRSVYSQKESCIFWTIMWCMPTLKPNSLEFSKETSAEKIALLDHQIDERVTWKECLENVRNNISDQKDSELSASLSWFLQGSDKDIVLYMKQADTPANDPLYFQFQTSDSIMSSLNGTCVIEFPEIIVEMGGRESQKYQTTERTTVETHV